MIKAKKWFKQTKHAQKYVADFKEKIADFLRKKFAFFV